MRINLACLVCTKESMMGFFCSADLHHIEDISASHDGTMLEIVLVLVA